MARPQLCPGDGSYSSIVQGLSDWNSTDNLGNISFAFLYPFLLPCSSLLVSEAFNINATSNLPWQEKDKHEQIYYFAKHRAMAGPRVPIS